MSTMNFADPIIILGENNVKQVPEGEDADPEISIGEGHENHCQERVEYISKEQENDPIDND